MTGVSTGTRIETDLDGKKKWKKRHTLRITVGDSNIAATAVGDSGASVVLNSAAALESSTLFQEGGAVDSEGTVRGVILNDRRCGTAQVTSEGLDVVAGSKDAGEAGEHGKGDCVLHLG